ncbi:hypothetical protein OPT61_g2467 [Boeremia exigua]|uniref:Uncharacterized protein n=1 Tax=Boeremia exigua TaxID=749465 RepID=A0ACC2ILD9_9PLEO|nr:hypothetical protein OPT61_g2467 [Boeremia exigua]
MATGRGSDSSTSTPPKRPYRYLNGRSTNAVALSTMPDTAQRVARDRAKHMLLASVRFSNLRDGGLVKAGRPSRGQQSHTKKPPKTLAQRPPRPDTTKACRQTGVHLQPAGDRSFAVRL